MNTADILSILNDDELMNIRNTWISKLSQLYNSGQCGNVFFLNGRYGESKVSLYEFPETWVREAAQSLCHKAGEWLRNPHVFRPLCIEFGPYGVHYIDRMLGAEVFHEAGQWYAKYLETPVGSLEPCDLDRDETWALSRRAARAFIELNVRLPYFGLPTISSALNVIVNLYGQEFLVAACVDEDKAFHDLQVINDLLCQCHRWYIENIPSDQLQPVVAGHRTQPPGYGQLCGCTTQLLSPSLYRDLVAPFDEQLLSVYANGGMIHLCGTHVQHIETWRAMSCLKAVQLNDRASEDLEAYFVGLRDDQIIYLNPCEGMTTDKAIAITGGKRLVVVGDTDKPISFS